MVGTAVLLLAPAMVLTAVMVVAKGSRLRHRAVAEYAGAESCSDAADCATGAGDRSGCGDGDAGAADLAAGWTRAAAECAAAGVAACGGFEGGAAA